MRFGILISARRLFEAVRVRLVIAEPDHAGLFDHASRSARFDSMKARFAEATGTNSGNPIDGSQTTLLGGAPIQTAPVSRCVRSNKHLSDVPGSAP